MAAPQKRYNRRHTFFVDPYFQGRFITWVIASNLVISLAFYVGQRVFYWTYINSNKRIGIPESDPLIQSLRQQEASMGFMYMGVFFLVTCISVIVALYFSHRIAGPLYHLKKFLREHTQGISQEKVLRFRKGDYFHDLAETVNGYRESEQKPKGPST